MSDLSQNAQVLLERRYLHPGEKSWADVAQRITRNVAIKASFGIKDVVLQHLLDRIWLPNSPCIWGAGSKTGGLFACFVVGPEEDILESHAEALKDVATVTKFGGGCGFTGTFIRPEGRPVYGSAHGKAYGPNRWAVNVSNYAKMISQGGVRNAALMYTLRSDHEDLPEFINLKQTADESFANNFNQSIMATDKWMNAARQPGTIESQLLSRVAFNAWNNGEPGLLFYDTINSRSPYRHSNQTIEATNPCITGETLIAVADGRNAVSIRQLFEEGRDVPVYSLDEKTGRIEVKMGRNPRITGLDKPVLKVTLDDGSTFRATPNHKMIVWVGDGWVRKPLSECESGESLARFDSYRERGRRQIASAGPKIEGEPIRMRRSSRQYQLIWKFHNGNPTPGHHIHHQDFNPLNDAIDNLSLLDAQTHRDLHASMMEGDRNPFNRALAGEFGEEHLAQWRERLSEASSAERNGMYSGKTSEEIYAFLDAMVQILGYVPTHDQAKRWMQSAGYPYYLNRWRQEELGGGVTFILKQLKRKHGFKTRKAAVTKFKKETLGVNHKIVSIEPDGQETVYNLTVDDNHNYAVITSSKDSQAIASSGLVIANCGEQGLPSFGSCNLGSINLSHENFISGAGNFSFDELEKTTRLMTRFLDDVGTVNHFPNQKFANWYETNRPIGIGVMGFAGLLHQLGHRYGDTDSTKLIGLIMRQITEVAYNESIILGREFGIPSKCEPLGRRNATVSSIAPTGSIAILADCEHSIEPPFSPMYTRIDQDGNVYEVEHPVANQPFFMSTVNSDPKKIPTPMEHLLIQAAAQNDTDAGVSKTINLPNNATPDVVRQIMIVAWELGCKGITVYRDGSRQLQVLNDKPKSKGLSEEAQALLDFDPSCMNGVCKV